MRQMEMTGKSLLTLVLIFILATGTVLSNPAALATTITSTICTNTVSTTTTTFPVSTISQTSTSAVSTIFQTSTSAVSTISETSTSAVSTGSQTSTSAVSTVSQTSTSAVSTVSQTSTSTATISSSNCRMTGGGSIFDPLGTPNTRITHGFEIHCDVTHTPNRIEINWAKDKFHLATLTTASCIDDPLLHPGQPAPNGFDTFVGTGVGVDGKTIEFTFTDDGEPGKGVDHAKYVIKGPGGNTLVDAQGYLEKGNHQTHNN